MRRLHTVREYRLIDIPDLNQEELEELRSLKTPKGEDVFEQKPGGSLAASNYIGVVTIGRDKVVEVLPKIDLGPDDETTKRLLLQMLLFSRYLRIPEKLPQGESDIRAVRRFPMLHVFVHQFLVNLEVLIRGGPARRYVLIEENLPYLRGRILFREQIRQNLTNQARFYVAHDELSVNRPANRLIHSTLTKLTSLVRNPENRRRLRLLRQKMEIAEVPQAANAHADWQRHQVDRSMPHYGPVMQWVGLFLFGHGLATYSGRHRNLSLLFPMEQVFEDFVTHSFRRWQSDYRVTAQRPQKALAFKVDNRGTPIQPAFEMKPDISLWKGDRVAFILDAKWKRIDTFADAPKHRIEQDDMYQLYAYGKRYGCDAVALVYPQTGSFTTELRYRFDDDLTLICLPFDVASPWKSAESSIKTLEACLAPQ